MSYLENGLDSIQKSLAWQAENQPANIPTKFEMDVLVRFEVFEKASQVQENLQPAVYKPSAKSHRSLTMYLEFILRKTSLSNWTTVGRVIVYTLLKSK